MKRLLIASLAVNFLLGVAAVAWLTWVTVEPRYWFPGAYAPKGEQGEPGPRGPRGPVGPSGPVGPDAREAIEVIESDIRELASMLAEVESDLATLSSMSGFSELETEITDLSARLDALCDHKFVVADVIYYGGRYGYLDSPAC